MTSSSDEENNLLIKGESEEGSWKQYSSSAFSSYRVSALNFFNCMVVFHPGILILSISVFFSIYQLISFYIFL